MVFPPAIPTPETTEAHMAEDEAIRVLEFGDPEQPIRAYTARTRAEAVAAAQAYPDHRFFDHLGRRLALEADGGLDDVGGPEDDEVHGLVAEALQVARSRAQADEATLRSPDLGNYQSLEDFDGHAAWLLSAPTAADLVGALQPALFPENEISRKRLCKLFRTC